MKKQLSFVVVYTNSNGGSTTHQEFNSLSEAETFKQISDSNGYNVYGLFDTTTDANLMEQQVGHLMTSLARTYYIEYIDTPGTRTARRKRNRKGYWLMVEYYLGAAAGMGGAILIAWLMSRPPHIAVTTSPIFAILAAFCYSTGTLGYLVADRLGTWYERSMPERINLGLLAGTYFLGTLFTVLSLLS